MRIAKHVGVATVLLMWSIVGLSQQLRLGKNPYALQKSAILELESDNQGLLFPRITDTTLINTLTPPDGMVIFHQPSRQLMVRSNGYWKSLASVAAFSNYWGIDGNSNGSMKRLGNIDNFDLSLITNNAERVRILANGNTGIGNSNPLQKLDVTGNMNLSGAFMPSNNAGTSGYVLRSNGAGLAPSWTNLAVSNLSDATITTPASGQLLQYNGSKWVNTTPSYLSSIDTTNIPNFFVKVRSLLTAAGPLTFSNGQFGIPKATVSVNGYLSSADWTTFNNKLSSVDTTNISNFYQKVRGLFSAGAGIGYNNSTGVVSNTGIVSLNGNSGALIMDTGYIGNFYQKVRGLSSATAPITYSNGQIGITQAAASTDGYLSSADWNNFNNKASAGNTWQLGGNTVTTPKNIGTIDNNDLPFITNNTEKMRITSAGKIGIGTTSPASALHVSGTNPLTLTGLQPGLASDSLLTVDAAGTVRKRKVADLINGSAISSMNGLTNGIQTLATGLTGTDFNISSSGSAHTFNLPDASATARGVLTTGGQTIAGSKTFSSAPLFSSLTPGSVPFIGAGGVLSQNNAAFFWDAANSRLGLNTSTPGSDLTLSQSAGGASPSRGFRFTGNSIGGSSSGTGFALSLGYNVSNNKQLWLGDADYLGNAAGVFVRYSSSSGHTIMDAIDGTNTSRKPLSLGIGGDANAGVILGSDGSSTPPTSYIWANGEMAIGNAFRSNEAPANGLAVQGNVGIGTSTLDGTNPEKLLVDAGTTTSVNAIVGKGSIDSYLQLNIQNKSTGTSASSDVVATANNGSEISNYIDMGINGSNYSGGVMGASNDAYLYNLGQNLLIGTGTASKSLIFMTGGTSQGTNERMRIDGTGKIGIGTTTPSSVLHVKSGVTDQSGVRMENLTSASATTSGAATLGVDASGNVVRAKAPVYYSGGIGGSATVDGITKVWVAEVTNTSTGIQTIIIPTNIAFSSIVGITLTAKGGSDQTNSPVAIVTSNTTAQIIIHVIESKTTGFFLGGSVEGMEAHTSTATKIYIRVEGN